MCVFQVMGLGTDGAAVMASDMNGLNGLMTEDNPYCVYVHCVCHSLQLAISQACKAMSEMDAIQELISGEDI